MEKPWVLLVDDNEATTTLLTALLHKEFEIDIASDGLDAVDKLKTKHYAAVILDLLMPQLDGYGVLDFVAQHNPHQMKQILVVSAALSRPQLTRLQKYGVCEVISKPFEVDHILGSVRRCAGPPFPARGPLISNGVILLLAEMLRLSR